MYTYIQEQFAAAQAEKASRPQPQLLGIYAFTSRTEVFCREGRKGIAAATAGHTCIQEQNRSLLRAGSKGKAAAAAGHVHSGAKCNTCLVATTK